MRKITRLAAALAAVTCVLPGAGAASAAPTAPQVIPKFHLCLRWALDSCVDSPGVGDIVGISARAVDYATLTLLNEAGQNGDGRFNMENSHGNCFYYRGDGVMAESGTPCDNEWYQKWHPTITGNDAVQLNQYGTGYPVWTKGPQTGRFVYVRDFTPTSGAWQDWAFCDVGQACTTSPRGGRVIGRQKPPDRRKASARRPVDMLRKN